ncbi:hypothetical protein J3Q64DRAFT_1735044 [Phycomyces blakesleeanus]|uniref:Phospholipase n=2 Tax=Phycomyces blakesleeanus TaxID=4837 RepID=A0A162PTJ5_PHYB8|nr:hypothetical protein PHYBLDRAFT_132024 [Phycomyces blakesleeanus NRRL 1555(-)]OAD75857.1 hypothetical protein PHYBLDRAFT_132024 [Phycomyces blakesleeanus NRRL 1555(-)]|eukprot:XP_018293897.1 hypothetical protein PHYBLDRAFT_132024 [Phycomyces blakesleeanus NRRL 1555(-)]
MAFFQTISSTVSDSFKSIFGNSNCDETTAIDAIAEEEEKREAGYASAHHRNESFAPVRHDTSVKYYVDGQDYCWAVSEAISKAKEAIFIEDWWLTPELYLRRPPSKYPEYRVDALLKRKAEEGVKIYIVIYKEVELALTLDSEHTKKTLQALHENIVVLRHPDHAIGGTFFWSHHEKFVVVDNRIAFLGGIDLCFGRWDTHTHRLADFHAEDNDLELFPGQDYSDARVRDFENVKEWDMRLIDKTVVPRMPWHDMSLCVMGGPVLDVVRHFCERWNFIKHEKAMDKEHVPFLQPPVGGFGKNQRFSINNDDELTAKQKRRKYKHHTRNVTGTCRSQVLRSAGEWSLDIETEHSIQNAYINLIKEAKHFVYIENQFFITATDDDKDYVLKNQIGTAIVSRIIRAHEEREKFKVMVLMPLMPAFPADLATKEAATARLVMHYQYISICRGNKSIVERLKAAGIEPDDYIRFYSLRSYDRINRNKLEELLAAAAGVTSEEKQLANAAEGDEPQKVQFIKHAGNPDFAEGTEGATDIEAEVDYARVPGEEEAESLRNKYQEDIDAVRARLEEEGEYVADDSIAQDAMKGGDDIEDEPWVNDTEGSAPRDEAAEKQEVSDYVSEELYIHAKLLIVDDITVVMGSSNLNDRSQCGERDSEIALMVEDQDMIPSKMNGEDYKASRFAATLRRQLWKEHLGLLPDRPTDEVVPSMLPLPVPQEDVTESEEDLQVMDPLDDATLSLWNSTAKINTEAFREVFHCVPDDNVKTWEEYKAFYPDPTKIDIGHVYDPDMSVDEVRGQLSKINGHLVEFPYHFLEEVDLQGESIPFITEATQALYT